MQAHGWIRAQLLERAKAPAGSPCRAASQRARPSSGRRASHGRQEQRRGNRVLNDHYFRQAKQEDFLSRAAFKLMQLDDKFQVLRKGGPVLDLGCFPGAWLQVACVRTMNKGSPAPVVGIDLKEMGVPVKHCHDLVQVITGDAREVARSSLLSSAPRGFQTVLSDMCHNTSGAAVLDVGVSISLCETAMLIAAGHGMSQDELDALPRDIHNGLKQWRHGVLRHGGALVMKTLEGSGTSEFVNSVRPHFKKVAFFRPQATRQVSREVYVVCKGYKGALGSEDGTNINASSRHGGNTEPSPAADVDGGVRNVEA